ncbi:hypothetical protein [Nonomuraea sp. 10N515B]|uniref:hypothetical protein n=1 Tax=Nonomuraea sp. 10N515B TaxID=3457422 RepID=UPI003FCE3EED
MAALPLQVLIPDGSASTLVAAAGGGDTAPTGDNVFLEVNNANAATRTLVIATPGTVRGLTIQDRSIPIPAGERWKIPLPSSLYAGADGQASITYTPDAASVTVGVFRAV